MLLAVALLGLYCGASQSKEKMNWDPDIPVKDKISRLCRMFPHIPYDTVHVVVGDTPDWSVDQYAELLSQLRPRDVEANSVAQSDSAPAPAPALPFQEEALPGTPAPAKRVRPPFTAPLGGCSAPNLLPPLVQTPPPL